MKVQVTGIIMFLTTVTVAKHHHYSIHKSILKLKSNFFGKVNEDVHVIIEKLFTCFNLNANFTKQPSIKLLLTMHYDLSNIANKNFDMLNEIQNITTVKIHNDTMIKADTVVAEILNANNFNVYEKVKGRKSKHKYGTHEKKSLNQTKYGNISAEFGDSKEFLDFVIDFVEKINNLSIQDFKQLSNVSKYFVSNRRNLKVWEPPSSIKIDNFNGTQTRRLYNGVETRVKKYPFIVSIHVMGEFTCAGCIISRDIIITAASCLQVAYKNEFFVHNPKSIYVRLGSDYTLRDGETIPIHKLYFHPLYDPESLRHNLALLKLERRILFKKHPKKIRRILWDKTPGKLRDNTGKVLILGWGAINSDQIIDKHLKLRVDVLDVYNLNECKDIYSEDFVTEESFCAGFVNAMGGACNGDVGGPGIVGEVLMGIVSFGAPVCGTRDTPTVFTKLGYYAAWIESIMGPQAENRQSQLESLYTKTRRKHSNYFEDNVLYLRGPIIENKKLHVDREEYPEDVKVLRDILNELIQSNNTVVDDLLYGELYDDFKDLFASEEKIEDIQHPLINKSLVHLPGIHFNPKNVYVTMLLTTSSILTPIPKRSTPTSPIDHTIYNVGSTNTIPVSEHLRIENKYSPKRLQMDDETDSDTTQNDDTDNYESTKENHRGLSIEEVKESQENYEIKTGHLKSYSTIMNKYSVKDKKHYNSKKNTSKMIPFKDMTRVGTEKKIKDRNGMSDDSYEKEQNSMELGGSLEKKQMYYSEEKIYSSDKHSEELKKDSHEEDTRETKESSTYKDSDTKEQTLEESSRSYIKELIYSNEIKRSESNEQSEGLKITSSEKKSYSQETKENFNINKNIAKSDSNSEEHFPTKIPIVTHMVYEDIPAGWRLIKPKRKFKRSRLISQKNNDIHSEKKDLRIYGQRDRRTTRITHHNSKKAKATIEGSIEMAILVNKPKHKIY